MSIVNYWPEWFRALCFENGKFPRSYCCIDLETTGFSFDRDLITEWGHCLVQDGKVVDQLSLVINWTDNVLGIADHWLRTRLEAVQTGMAMNGAICHMSYDRMQSEGLEPIKALTFIRNFHATLAKKGTIFVAHNGTFDEKMLTGNLRAFKIAPAFTFGDNGLIDTECIAKASQILTNSRVHPKRNDTLRSYFHRVKYTRVEGVKSNLDGYCYNQFLRKHGIKKEDMHGAEMDSYCCHILMQEFGSLVTEPIASPVFPNEEHKDSRKLESKARLQPDLAKRIRGQRNS